MTSNCLERIERSPSCVSSSLYALDNSQDHIPQRTPSASMPVNKSVHGPIRPNPMRKMVENRCNGRKMRWERNGRKCSAIPLSMATSLFTVFVLFVVRRVPFLLAAPNIVEKQPFCVGMQY